MFQLIKIEYGRDNIPEPLLMPATDGVRYTVGMALYLDTTSHTLAIAKGDSHAEYVAMEDKTAKAGDMLLCYQIYPQMLFEATLANGTAKNAAVGSRLQFSEDGCSLSSAIASDMTVVGGVVKAATGGMVISTVSASDNNNSLVVRL